MLFSNGVVVQIASPQMRDPVLAALRSVAAAVSSTALQPIAVMSDDGGDAQHSYGLPVIQVWADGRTPSTTTPFGDPRLRHLLGTRPVVDVDILTSTLRHLADGWPLGIDVLVPRPTSQRRFALTRAEDRPQVERNLRDALGGLRDDLREELITLGQELIVNALYDAVMHEGKAVYRNVSRTIPVPVVRPVGVQVAIDERVVAVSVRDAFGSLTPEQIIESLRRSYAAGTQQIESKHGGAGLGLYMALAGSHRLVFNIRPGVTTEVVVLRRHALRRGQFQASAPSLNICVIEENHAGGI